MDLQSLMGFLSQLFQHPGFQQMLSGPQGGGMYGQPGAGGAPGFGGAGGGASDGAVRQPIGGVPRTSLPGMRSPMSGGTPGVQGYAGAGSSVANPNEGGFSGLGGSEMITPGMGAGLYGGGAPVFGW